MLARWPQLAGKVGLRPVAEGSTANGRSSEALVEEGIRPLPFAASAVLTSSGTMSLHCALAGIPGAVVYRTNPLTYLFARWLVKVDFIGIANLLLKEPMYPEFIQGAATPAALAAELRDSLENPERLEKTQAQQVRLRALLSQTARGTAADWLARRL